MCSKLSITIALTALIATPVALPAQSAAEEAAMIATSVAHVTESSAELTGTAIPPAEVVFDPAVLVDGRRGARHPEAVMSAVRGRLGVRVAPLDEIRRCDVAKDAAAQIASCRLEGARAVVATGAPEAEADGRQRVPVEVVHQVDRDARQPVHRTLVDVVLVRTDDGWQVDEVRTRATT
jgi:hypothetical protein